MIQFDDATHQYSKLGSTYISATQLLKKYGLSVDYGGIPAAVLAKAAAKGNAVHKALEEYIKGDQSMILLFNEVNMFDQYIKARGIDLSKAKSEEMLCDDQYQIAGTIDFQYIEGNTYYVSDFKTTSSLHIDVVAWQLSIYNYLVSGGDMLKYYFNQMKVFHFTNGRMYVKDVYTIDYDAVKELFEAHKNNLPTYTYVRSSKVITPTQDTVLNQIMNEIETYDSHLNKLKEERDKLLMIAKENMITQKDYSYKTNTLNITYMLPQERRSLDTTKVKNYLTSIGEDIDSYMRTTITSDSIRISLIKDPTLNIFPDSDDKANG